MCTDNALRVIAKNTSECGGSLFNSKPSMSTMISISSSLSSSLNPTHVPKAERAKKLAISLNNNKQE